MKLFPNCHSAALALAVGVSIPAGARAEVASLDSLRLSGFVETSFQHSTASEDGTITGSLYGRQHDQFSLNAFELGLDCPIESTRRMAGFTVRALYGRSATFIHAAGLDIGPQADLTQAFVTYNRPAGAGSVQISAGKFVTMLGQEVIESVLNPNLSVGNQFLMLENFTHVGLDVNWTVNSRWALRGCVLNGWDVAVDNNRAPSFMGRVGLIPDPNTSVALLGYVGPEQPNNVSDRRYGGELLANRAFGSHSAALQLDVGREDGIDAAWWGAGAWVTLALAPTVALAMRADYIDDEDGARTSGILGYPVLPEQKLGTLTATLNLRPTPRLMVRPEVRYDHSDQRVYHQDREQVTLAVGAAMSY